jgi:hypothetical protein
MLSGSTASTTVAVCWHRQGALTYDKNVVNVIPSFRNVAVYFPDNRRA